MAYIDIVDCLREYETTRTKSERWPGRPIGSPARSLYPNLAAEYMCSGYHLWVLAEHANVSKEIISAVIEDGEPLELHELYSLSRLFGCSMEYLMSPRLSVLDPNTHRGALARYKLNQIVEQVGVIPDTLRDSFAVSLAFSVVSVLKRNTPIYFAFYHYAISVFQSIIQKQEWEQRKRTKSVIGLAC